MKKHVIFLTLPALLLALLATLAIQGIAFAAPLQPQRALATCSSAPSFQNCDNVYPDADICPADAQPLVTANIVDSNRKVLGQVLVMYSNHCQSAWGKITSTVASRLVLDLDRNGAYFAGASTNTTGTSIRTVMAYAVFQAMRACGSINGYSACTA
ncbi:MAG TPA: DUF2690 domain-containing protein [Ktedonobacteraceae bacterium]